MGIYRGRDSNGLVTKYPFIAAAFSPCLPNPNEANFSLSIVVSELPLDPVCKCDTKDGGLDMKLFVIGVMFTGPTCVGMTLFACSRHDVTERLDLADSRKMRPTRTLRHPMEKRKKADTRVKVSTW